METVDKFYSPGHFLPIVQDACICGLKVDAKASRTCGQNETELFAIGSIEGIDRLFSVLVRRVSVNSAVLVPTHNLSKLAEVKFNVRPSSIEPSKNPKQQKNEP